jgi:threo-3-hydroxy-L-aspartate ammonia-lyase
LNFQEIQKAAERLQGVANLTPVMTSRTLDAWSGDNRVFLKCENFQRSGAFKFRGAYNTMVQLGEAERRAGVITFSSGNHAQATALAGKLLGVKVVVVMPSDAPAVKREATEGYGAEVILYKPGETDREALAKELQAQHGYTLIPPFNHPHVIAGQGTATKELIESQDELDVVLAPCGGGGTLSGAAIAARHLLPKAKVIGVEPEGANNGQRAFQAGHIVRVEHPQTMADGLKPQALGELTFAIIREYVDDMVTVSEEEIRSTLAFVWTRMKLIIEPSGVVGLAPVLHRKLGLEGKRVGVICTGGNCDIGAIADWLRAAKA